MAYGVMETQDLVQETVLVVMQKWNQIQKKDSLLAFMVGVAHNQIRMALRKMQRQTRLEMEKEALRKMESKTQNAELAYDIHLMYQAMDKLAERERECLILFEISGFSIKEIVEIQGDGESAIKARLSRARHKLKGMLDDELSEETKSQPVKVKSMETPTVPIQTTINTSLGSIFAILMLL